MPLFFIRYLWMSNILLTVIGVKSTLKSRTFPYSPVFFILFTEKSVEMPPRHISVWLSFISYSFALNL